MPVSEVSNVPDAAHDQIERLWAWFLALGLSLVVLGVVCILGAATASLITELALGWLLLLAGVLALVQAFRTRSWAGFLLYVLAASLRGAVGILLIRFPVAGELSLTLLIAAVLIVGGMFRGIGAATLRFPQWGWAVASGFVSLAVGLVLLVQLESASLWFLGMAVGVDFIFEGAGLVALSAGLRGLRPLA